MSRDAQGFTNIGAGVVMPVRNASLLRVLYSGAILLGVIAMPRAHAQDCDRACLRGVLESYLGAVFAHDPGAAPLAPDYRATENAAPLENGASLWRSALGYGAVGRHYFDVRAGQAAYYGLISEGPGPAIVSLRLQVKSRRVAEAEWTVARAAAGGMFSTEGLIANPPPAETALPKEEQRSRTTLIATANAYFDALQRHDGSMVPHVEGCERIENGVKVTHRESGAPAPATGTATPAGSAPGVAQEARSGDCIAGFEAFAHSIAQTSHRRFPLIDEEAGVVMGATIFHRPPESTLRRNLLTEYFFERKGKIAAIYAAMFYLAPEAPDSPGW